MKYIIKKILLAIVISLIQVNFAFAMEVAITVDDLPENGDVPDHLTRMDIVKKMVSVFKKHHITGVYGLINGGKLNVTVARFFVAFTVSSN